MSRFLERFRPDESVASVCDIDLDALGARGIGCLMVDLDNTLLPWKDSIVPDQVARWVERAKGMGMRLCIVSNTHNPRRLRRIAEGLGIPCVYRALKPRRCGFLKAAGLTESLPSHTAVVGDQLLTDILGGNLAGMYTVLVRPMHRREFVGTKLSRLVERGILTLLSRSVPSGTKAERIQSETQDTK